MNRAQIIAVGLAVAAFSYLALIFGNLSDGVKALIALPGAGGLLTALWEVAKAKIEHDHRLDELAAENAFVIGATSHMAEVAFDKHVEFCEQYVKLVITAMHTLLTEGPTRKALHFAGKLGNLRNDYTLWEAAEVTAFLLKFEAALAKIGANEIYLKDVPVGPKRDKVVTDTYDAFKAVMDIGDLPEGSIERTSETAISFIIDSLREHLGVTDLTALRRYAIAAAVVRMKK